MIGLKVKVTNTAGPALDALVRAFEDQQALAKIAIEAAEPVAVVARAIIRRKTGKTADQITIWADDDAGGGSFRVYVGIPGPEVLGRLSRAFIGRFLEFGTSDNAAVPWLRPAFDAEGGAKLTTRFAAIARTRLAGFRAVA